MQFSTEEFMTLHDKLTAEELEIARLKEQVAQLTEERDYWQACALASGDKKGRRRKSAGRFIVFSVKKLKAVLSKIHDVRILSVVAFVLQKALPKESAAEGCKQLMDIVPLPQQPSLTVMTDCDVNVEGDWNDVHDNKDVNF